MNMQNSTKLILFVAGTLLILIGGGMILTQVDYYSLAGIQIGNNANLLNAISIPAGFLLAAGVNVIACIFVCGLFFAGTLLVAILYLSYAVWSMVSVPVEGMLKDVLIEIALLELAIGLICLMALFLHRLIQREVWP
jgi:hypothetical protein